MSGLTPSSANSAWAPPLPEMPASRCPASASGRAVTTAPPSMRRTRSLQFAQHEAIAADADDARRRPGHHQRCPAVAVEPAGIAGVDEALGVGLEMRRAEPLGAGREGMARHHRAAQRERAGCGARDLRHQHGVAPSRAAPSPRRPAAAPAGRRRRGASRAAPFRRTPARRPAWRSDAARPGWPTAAPASRQTASTFLQLGMRQQTGVSELRHQRARHDDRVAAIVAALRRERRRRRSA